MIKVFSRIFILCVLCSLACFFLSKMNRDPLQNISVVEKRGLEFLFRNLFLNQHFAYTLLGDKPVSTAGHFKIIPLGNLHASSYTFNNEWEIWEKYKTRFKFDNYLLINTDHPEVSGLRSITFINKKAFLNTVDENIDLFQSILGKDITPTMLLETIENSPKDLFEIIGKDEALYGILLGYGRTNSLRFKRYYEIYSYLSPIQTTNFSLKCPKAHYPFTSLKEEYEALQSKLQGGETEKSEFELVNTVHFGGDPQDLETMELREKYQKLKTKITKFYSNGQIFEKTMSILLSELK